jgi:hypothetical protein
MARVVEHHFVEAAHHIVELVPVYLQALDPNRHDMAMDEQAECPDSEILDCRYGVRYTIPSMVSFASRRNCHYNHYACHRQASQIGSLHPRTDSYVPLVL